MDPPTEVNEAVSSPSVPTGIEQLDRILDGGYPRRRSVLIEGGPGAGKSTLAVQFLQAGLDAGDTCLFLSTEQTRDELVDSFRSFPIDLDHENLEITSLHVQPGTPTENFLGRNITKRFGGNTEKGFVLRTLEGGQFIDEHHVSFTGSNIREYLSQLSAPDRVVVDSVSGLGTMAENYGAFRRAVLDLIRLFSDTFEATTLLTAEADSRPDRRNLLRYNTHGVVSLTHERTEGSYKRFLRVEKMRGVDHDERRYKLSIDSTYGIRLFPRKRTRHEVMNPHGIQPTALPGLDELLGGGMPKGAPTIIEHDGRADVDVLTAGLLTRAVEEGYAILLIAPPEWNCVTLNTYLRTDESVESLMADDRLFVFCGSERPDMDTENIVVFEEGMGETEYFEMLADLEEKNQGPWWSFVDIEAPMDFFTLEALKTVWRESAAKLIGEKDLITCLTNHRKDSDAVREFLYDISPQVLSFRTEADGVTLAHLDKSLTGQVGDAAVLDFPDQPPYVAFE